MYRYDESFNHFSTEHRTFSIRCLMLLLCFALLYSRPGSHAVIIFTSIQPSIVFVWLRQILLLSYFPITFFICSTHDTISFVFVLVPNEAYRNRSCVFARRRILTYTSEIKLKCRSRLPNDFTPRLKYYSESPV